MKADAFKPASGSREVAVLGTDQLQGPQLGDHFRIQAQPQPVQPAPMAVKQGGAQFVPASQPVQMAGPTPPVAAPPQGPPVSSQDKFRPAVSQQAQPPQPLQAAMGAQQPQPSPQLQAPKGAESFSVTIYGVGPDGQQYTAEMGVADFPVGTKIMGTARIQPLE